MAGDGFEITSEDIAISPYHLLAGSLASCIVFMIFLLGIKVRE